MMLIDFLWRWSAALFLTRDAFFLCVCVERGCTSATLLAKPTLVGVIFRALVLIGWPFMSGTVGIEDGGGTWRDMRVQGMGGWGKKLSRMEEDRCFVEIVRRPFIEGLVA